MLKYVNAVDNSGKAATFVKQSTQTPTTMNRPTLQQAKEMMTAKGYTPSKSSFDEDGRLYVFSVEASTPGTYGHPDAIIEYKYGHLTETYTEQAKAKKRLERR
jgi:hypothetical protein